MVVMEDVKDAGWGRSMWKCYWVRVEIWPTWMARASSSSPSYRPGAKPVLFWTC